jgi:hypothetical protein
MLVTMGTSRHGLARTLRLVFLVATPLVFAAALFLHPAGGENVYADVKEVVGAWLFVHAVFLFFVPLLGIAAYLLLAGIDSVAATVSRASLVFFLVFYTAYEVTVGVDTAILVDYANGRSPEEQTVLADAIQDLNRNAIVSDPSVALVLGALGWIVAMVAAAVALRRDGIGWVAVVLVGLAALFAIHPPPVGPIGLVCFAAGALLVERARAREPAVERAAGDVTPSLARRE